MEREDQLVIEAALNKMFKGSHFSICTIETVLELLNIPRGGRDYERLRAIHCVYYADMSEELKQTMMTLIGRVLSVPPIDVSAMYRRPEVAAAPVYTNANTRHEEREYEDPMIGLVRQARRLLGM